MPIDYDSTPAATHRAAAHLRRRSPLLAIPLILAAGLGFAYWHFTTLHVDEPSGYSSPSKVRQYTSLPPPPQAAHIRTAGLSLGMVYSHYVRFEAPVDVCVAYVKQLSPGTAMTAERPDALDAILQKDRPRFHDLSWFDLPSATQLLAANIPGGFVAVDTVRGVFYFWKGF
jgi:hypothetical protein